MHEKWDPLKRKYPCRWEKEDGLLSWLWESCTLSASHDDFCSEVIKYVQRGAPANSGEKSRCAPWKWCGKDSRESDRLHLVVDCKEVNGLPVTDIWLGNCSPHITKIRWPVKWGQGDVGALRGDVDVGMKWAIMFKNSPLQHNEVVTNGE